MFQAGCLVSLVILRCRIVVVIVCVCVCVCVCAVCSRFVSLNYLVSFVFLSVFPLSNFKKSDYKPACDQLTCIVTVELQ